ncbi:hypothetical protein [Burkholderia ubonensis]|uniref:hypothetical protein n=1 Tax=Burkholderia ubonensis TaxID=101571 RepID=UPI000A89DCF6|nr:hypothetical protein [Burkholderia ubonensis]
MYYVFLCVAGIDARPARSTAVRALRQVGERNRAQAPDRGPRANDDLPARRDVPLRVLHDQMHHDILL